MDKKTNLLGSAIASLCVLYQSFYRAIPQNNDVLLALPLGKESANPGLYSPHDLLVSSGMREPFHLYKIFGGWLYRAHLNVDLVWEAAFVVFLFAAFLAIWYIAHELTGDHLVGSAVLALIAVAHPLRGTLHATAVPISSFITASAAMPLALSALYALLRQRFTAANVLAGLTSNIHPYVGMLIAAATAVTTLNVVSLPMRRRFLAVGIGAACALPNAAYILLSLPQNFGPGAQTFFEQFRMYAIHAFIEEHWREGYGWFALTLAGALWFAREISEKHRRVILISLSVWMSAMAVYAINAATIRNTTLLLTFMFRATYFIKPLTFILLVNGLYRELIRELRSREDSAAIHVPHRLAALWTMMAVLFVSGILPMKLAVASDCLAFVALGIYLWSHPTVYQAFASPARVGLLVISFGPVSAWMMSKFGSADAQLLTENLLVGLLVVAAALTAVFVLRGRNPGRIDQPVQTEQGVRVPLLAAIGLLLFHNVIISLAKGDWPLIPDLRGNARRIFMHDPPIRAAGLFRWAQTQSLQGSMFVLPPDQWEELGGFRLVAERGVFVTTMEVNQLAFDVSVYATAHRRLQTLGVRLTAPHQFDASGYDRLSDSTWAQLAQTEGCAYAVFEREKYAGRFLPFPQAYADSNYVVLRLPSGRDR